MPRREGPAAGGRAGSLRRGRRGPVRLRGRRPGPRLCLLRRRLLIGRHALLQPEDLAHGAGGEGEGSAPAGRGETRRQLREEGREKSERRGGYGETIKWGGGHRAKTGSWGFLQRGCACTGWPHRSRFLSVFSSRFMDSEASVTSSSSCCSLLRTAWAREASSSASSSCLFSCFTRRLPFSSLCGSRGVGSCLWVRLSPRAPHVSLLHPDCHTPCLLFMLLFCSAGSSHQPPGQAQR